VRGRPVNRADGPFALNAALWSFLSRLLLALAAIVFTLRPSDARKPQDQPQNSAEHPLEAKTELVKLDVTVLNEQGDFVDGLDQESFRVLDNGVERPVVFFAPVTAPAKVVVVLETSPAVYLFQDEHIAAAYWLVAGLANEDEVALVTYSDLPKSVVSFTTNKSQLLGALGNVQYMVGAAALNLYDSVSAVVDGISAFPGKKALVLLTTGLDSSPRGSLDRLTEKLRKADAVIFAVGLGGSFGNDHAKKAPSSKRPVSISDADLAPAGSSPVDKARNALTALSVMTGGRAYFPLSADEFAAAYREIASAVRHEYALGIAPGHDGQPHALRVEVLERGRAAAKKKHGRSEYRVFARDGYMAPAR
jgi:Ca-activated chloride channel homolog